MATALRDLDVLGERVFHGSSPMPWVQQPRQYGVGRSVMRPVGYVNEPAKHSRRSLSRDRLACDACAEKKSQTIPTSASIASLVGAGLSDIDAISVVAPTTISAYAFGSKGKLAQPLAAFREPLRPGHQNPNGLSRLIPSPSKCSGFEVTSTAPWTTAVAAMTASVVLSSRPPA